MTESEKMSLNVENALIQICTDLRKLAFFLLEDKIASYLSSSNLRSGTLNLCDGQHTVGEIAQELEKAQSNVSAAISELLSAGLVRIDHRDGRSTYYIRTV